jgi:hypothetical protein
MHFKMFKNSGSDGRLLPAASSAALIKIIQHACSEFLDSLEMAGHALSAIQQYLNINFKAVDLWSFDLGPTYIKPVSKYAFCFDSEPKERKLFWKET